MDINQERLGIPQQDYKSTVRMPSSEFQRISRDLGVIGDSVTLAVHKDEIKFSVSGEIGDGNVSLRSGGSADKGDQTVVEVHEPVTSSFALKYFINFTKATSLSPVVQLQMNPDVPLVVQYKMENAGFIRFYLAPKIDEDAQDEDK